MRGLKRRLTDGLQDAALWLLRHGFTATERLRFYENLAFLLKNNIPLKDAFNHMLTSSGKGHRLAGVNSTTVCIRDCLQALSTGVRLDAAMADWLPEQEVAFITTGLANGQLASTLERAAFVVSNLKEIQVGLMSLIYPIFLLATTFGMIYATGAMMLPTMEQLTPRNEWTGALWLTGVLANFELDNWPVLLCLLLGLTIFVIWSMKNLTGRVRRFLDNFLPWSIYKDLQGASFLINYAALMKAGVSPKDALLTLTRFASPWLKERLVPASAGLNRGLGLGPALEVSGHNFPSADCISTIKLIDGGNESENIIETFAVRVLETTQAAIKRKFFRLRMYAMLLNTLWLILSILANQQIGVFH